MNELKSFIFIFFLLVIGCRNQAQTGVNQSVSDFKEEKNVIVNLDYFENQKINKLVLDYEALNLEIAYLNERAYLKVSYEDSEWANWTLVNVNYFYDNSFESAAEDTHLLLNSNDLSQGYILFPSFTEEYRTYSLYSFARSKIVYVGEFECQNVDCNGLFDFTQNNKKLFNETNKGDKVELVEIEKYPLEVSKDELNSDLKLIDDENISAENVDIDNYLKNSDYLVKEIDVNQDDKLDYVITHQPYLGNELLIYLNDGKGNFNETLKTINFSEDGGNQLSDIKETPKGFEIITLFPDRGHFEADYYIEFHGDKFYLKKIVEESLVWQDDVSKTTICNYNVNIDMSKIDDLDFSKLEKSCSTK